MKNMIKMGLVLMIITLVSGIALSLTNNLTISHIKKNEQTTLKNASYLQRIKTVRIYTNMDIHL